MSAERFPHTLIIVRRRHDERFRVLQDTFAGEPVEVTWDRRMSQRRQRHHPPTADRRSRDRRGPLPISWTALDFVVVHPVDRPEPG